VKSREDSLLIYFRNANALIADNAPGVRRFLCNRKANPSPWFGVLYRVAQQIRENVPKQSFVGVRLRQV
jgi:hypothetical protein